MIAQKIKINVEDNWGGGYEIRRDDKDIELWGFNKDYPLKGLPFYSDDEDGFEFTILAGCLFQVHRSSDCFPQIESFNDSFIIIDLGGEYEFTDEDYITKIK